MELLDDVERGAGPEVGKSRIQRTRYHLLSFQAENYLALGRLRPAAARLAAARELVPDIGAREVKILDSLRHAALSLAQGSGPAAHEELTSAIGLAKEMGMADFEWRGHYLRGQLLRREGRWAAAQACYEEAIRLIESLSRSAPEKELALSFLAERYDPYRALISLASRERHDGVAAFGYVERSRAKALRMRRTEKTFRARAEALLTDPSPMLASLQKGLPRDVTIVEYFLGREEALAFIVSAHAFHWVSLPAKPEAISAGVNVFLDHLQKGRSAESKGAGRQLYQLLIDPVKAYLEPQSTLCIIPDDKLFYIPFSALVTDQGHFLIEDYRLTQAPSARLLSHQLESNTVGAAAGARRVLVVATDARLEQARATAQSIYESGRPQAMYLSQPDPRTLAAVTRHFDLVYFIGHATIWKGGSPALVFAKTPTRAPRSPVRLPEGGEEAESVLRREDVMRWDLSNVWLVGLAACGTGLGKYQPGEGVVGLADAFLSAGAPALLVSLWDVQGASSRLLIERFHANLQKKGLSRAEALRQAQIGMIRSAEPYGAPSHWAPFMLVGDPR